MIIEGVPSGWELVRIGTPKNEEWYIDDVGHVVLNEIEDHAKVAWPIVRKAEPVCTWPHGVYADGWLTQDNPHDDIEWHEKEPRLNRDGDWWASDGCGGPAACGLLNPPVFRADLPWTERIVKVGPSAEKEA